MGFIIGRYGLPLPHRRACSGAPTLPAGPFFWCFESFRVLKARLMELPEMVCSRLANEARPAIVWYTGLLN
jgi:hypothetical protein